MTLNVVKATFLFSFLSLHSSNRPSHSFWAAAPNHHRGIFFLFSLLQALQAICEALFAGTEVIHAGSEPLPAVTESLPAGLEALPADSEALSASQRV